MNIFIVFFSLVMLDSSVPVDDQRRNENIVESVRDNLDQMNKQLDRLKHLSCKLMKYHNGMLDILLLFHFIRRM